MNKTVGHAQEHSLSWVAVRCKHNQELSARDNLARQNFDAYLPLLQARRRRLGQWFDASEALFPGYLFAGADLSLQSLAPIRSTKGVLGLVRFGEHIALIPAAVVEKLRSAELSYSDRLHRDPRRAFISGDRIELTEGKFAGLRGVFSERDGKRRAFVLLELLGNVNRICIPLDWVSRAA